MRGEKNRSFLPMSLVPALLVVSAIAVVATQEVRAQSVRATNWSDPATWPDRKVPGAGDKVTIGKDKDVVLDVSPPALRSLTINGKLSFADTRDLELTTDWIYCPAASCRSAARPGPTRHKATITLTDKVKGENINTMGDRGIMMLSGTLSLHGDRAATPGPSSPPRPRPAPRDPGARRRAAGARATRSCSPRPTTIRGRPSARTITAISGNTLTLDKPLDYMHFGEITFGVDERGEVGHADPQHQDPGFGRRRDRATSAATSWRWPVEQDVRLGRRAEPHGPEHDAGPLPDPLAHGRRRARASTSRTRRSTTPTTAA